MTMDDKQVDLAYYVVAEMVEFLDAYRGSAMDGQDFERAFSAVMEAVLNATPKPDSSYNYRQVYGAAVACYVQKENA